MRSMMVMLLVPALMAGCAAQVSEGESEGATTEAVGSTASALQISGATESCPGGGAPVCAACSGTTCVYACAGGRTCKTAPNFCAYSPNACRTISFAPGGFGAVMY